MFRRRSTRYYARVKVKIDFCPQPEPLTGSYHQLVQNEEELHLCELFWRTHCPHCSATYRNASLVPCMNVFLDVCLLFLRGAVECLQFPNVQHVRKSDGQSAHRARVEAPFLLLLSHLQPVERATGWLLSNRGNISHCSCIELVKISFHCIKVKNKNKNFLVNNIFLA